MPATKRTKIVCTIGPASDQVETLEKMIDAGMNVARLNFSHGSHPEHLQKIKNIRQAAKNKNATIGIMLDTKGPEIRTHKMATPVVNINKGDVVRVAMQEVAGTNEKFSVTYEGLINDVKVGMSILLDDGAIILQVTEIDEENQEIVTKALNTGVLKDNKGVNVPGASISLPGLTQKDRDDIRFGLENGINFIAASFVRTTSDVLEIKALLDEYDAHHVQIIPKIENQEGVDNLKEIIDITDGMMVARGDLGVEVPVEEVPIIQKEIIRLCNLAGKPVITATHMLESMQEHPFPSRAEASDVANAIYDGSDAVMLSGESAAGQYPVEAVQTMANICVRTEIALMETDAYQTLSHNKYDTTEAIGQSVQHTAKNLGIKTIVATTESGYTARMISKYRPKADIIAFTSDERTAHNLTLAWGVVPYVADIPASTDEMFNVSTMKTLENGFAKEGDLIIITAGVPLGESGTTNIMKIQMIGSKLVSGQGVGKSTVVGKAIVAHSAEEANEKMVEGHILVAETTDKDYLPAIEKASAIVTEQGGLTSHAAVVGIAMGIPVIVSAEGIVDVIEQGEIITVDSRRGNVYRGSTATI